ncbi:hypothetical protein [Flavobacterium sp. LB1P62]|uniref:hypothetical protein n=1 Tax=Flavobacterium sp. LB1P62 TaxID=3401715 RepID=UPI003AB01067
MEKTSYTIEQLEGVKAFTKRAYDELTVIIGRTPSFREVIEYQYKYTENKESVKKLFPHVIKGWELNNCATEDYQAVYDDLFDPKKDETYVHSEEIANLFGNKPIIPPISSRLAQEESLEKNKETTVEKKNFKTLLGDFALILIGVPLFIAFFGFIGYQIYKDFNINSQQYQSLVFGILTFSLIVIIIFKIANKSSFGVFFDKIIKSYGYYFILIPILIFVIVPIFIILVKILIFILTFWFIWLAIILLILLVVILFSPISILKKILLIALIILTIYFFFEAKDILEFHFQTYFDNEKFHIGN